MSTEVLNLEMQRVARMIPGYDPFATAGDCWFDDEAAESAVSFVEENCKHVKGEWAGKPLKLEDWQKGIFANLFGWKRPDGTRRYRECLIFIPRKNSKTTMAAALVNYVLYCDGEPGAEVYSSAAEREQARLCYEVVCGMIRQEPMLDELADIFKYSLTVGTGSYKALSAEAGSKHGFNAHLIVNDELHAHKTPELTEVLMTSQGARRQPLCVHLTTSDYQRPGSVCNDKHDHATKVRDGIIDDPAFLPVIYEATTDDDWTDPKIWAKANPNLGISVSEEYIARECERAKESPAYENTFKRLHLNIRTEQAERFIQMEAWDECAGDATIPEGATCYVGLDLGSKRDITAMATVWEDDEECYRVQMRFWIPAETARLRGKADRVPYPQWIRDGLIEGTDGNSCDYAQVRRDINEHCERYNVPEIAIDPWNATQLQTELREEDGLPVIDFRQGYVSMSDPTKTLDAVVADRKLRHGGHPVLRWMASNVVVRQDPSGNLKPDKEKSGEKIDGIVALIMALGRAALQRETYRPYEDEGVTYLAT